MDTPRPNASKTDTTPVQRCLPNVGATETVTAGNGTRQCLMRRMSQNSRLHADVAVSQLGGKHQVRAGTALPSSEGAGRGLGHLRDTRPPQDLGTGFCGQIRNPRTEPTASPSLSYKTRQVAGDGWKARDRGQFLGPTTHQPSAPRGKWGGWPPSTSPAQLVKRSCRCPP